MALDVSTRSASITSSVQVLPDMTISAFSGSTPSVHTKHGSTGPAGQQTSSANFICRHTSLLSSVILASTSRSPHVLRELALIDVVSLTVIPDVHTLHGSTAGGGQQYGSADVISVQISGRTPAAAKTRRRSHVMPLASGRGMIELPGTVSPSIQIGQGTLVGAAVVFVVFVTGSLFECCTEVS